jgi:putative ABC transport system substrate-binding protein
MKRREFIAGLGSAATWPLVARAQPALPLVGWLGVGSSLEGARDAIDWFKQGLAETGFVEGRDFAFEYRWANYHLESMPALAADLVRRRVSVMVTTTAAGAIAAKAATQTIPIVFFVGIDPVAFGLVASYNRPGANITGVIGLITQLAAKRLEVLRELVPISGLFGVLANPSGPATAVETKELQAAANLLGVRLSIVNAVVPDEFENGIRNTRAATGRCAPPYQRRNVRQSLRAPRCPCGASCPADHLSGTPRRPGWRPDQLHYRFC